MPKFSKLISKFPTFNQKNWKFFSKFGKKLPTFLILTKITIGSFFPNLEKIFQLFYQIFIKLVFFFQIWKKYSNFYKIKFFSKFGNSGKLFNFSKFGIFVFEIAKNVFLEIFWYFFIFSKFGKKFPTTVFRFVFSKFGKKMPKKKRMTFIRQLISLNN